MSRTPALTGPGACSSRLMLRFSRTDPKTALPITPNVIPKR